MQSASSETFSVNFPSVYGHILTLRESIQAEHRKDGNCLSYINISLQELNFYDFYDGDDLTTRFRESCLEERGPVEVIADKTLPVAGHMADVRIAQSPDGNFYYFGLVIISNEYGYTITGDCTIDSREFYEPLFDEIWQSIRNVEAPAKKLKDQDDKTIAPPPVSVDDGNNRQTGHHMSTGATDIVHELRLTDPNPGTRGRTNSPLL